MMDFSRYGSTARMLEDDNRTLSSYKVEKGTTFSVSFSFPLPRIESSNAGGTLYLIFNDDNDGHRENESRSLKRRKKRKMKILPLSQSILLNWIM